MTKYIPLDALVAEIEKRVGFNKALNAYSRADECNAILSLIDTLEVKEVDLTQEIEQALNNLTNKDMRGWFKHFFELGLKAQKGE